MMAVKLRLAMAAMSQSETKVNDLCKELEITRHTLYRHTSRPRASCVKMGKTTVHFLTIQAYVGLVPLRPKPLMPNSQHFQMSP
jgi:hypothetical protein